MYIFPVSIRKYHFSGSRKELIAKLRNRTREPYFDNKNSRRLDVEDPKGTIYADEYDNMISLRNEVINKRWVVYKTLVVFARNGNSNYLWTISYPGHFATVLVMMTIAAIFIGIYFAVGEGNYTILLLAICVYLINIMFPTEDYQDHHDLLQDICNGKEHV